MKIGQFLRDCEIEERYVITKLIGKFADKDLQSFIETRGINIPFCHPLNENELKHFQGFCEVDGIKIYKRDNTILKITKRPVFLRELKTKEQKLKALKLTESHSLVKIEKEVNTKVLMSEALKNYFELKQEGVNVELEVSKSITVEPVNRNRYKERAEALYVELCSDYIERESENRILNDFDRIMLFKLIKKAASREVEALLKLYADVFEPVKGALRVKEVEKVRFVSEEDRQKAAAVLGETVVRERANYSLALKDALRKQNPYVQEKMSFSIMDEKSFLEQLKVINSMREEKEADRISRKITSDINVEINL